MKPVLGSRFNPIWRVSNGAIAQLGERVLCKHEVVGSIPSGSTRQAVADSTHEFCAVTKLVQYKVSLSCQVSFDSWARRRVI